ncbi:MAG: NYN domain-containing protein [Dehalococcoidales bacterium]|nr:NYN domain-containing protein [Dehalococcoidales bacterium]
MKTNVYIDGFNLYYRAVRETSYKWLDLAALCQALLPKHLINRIRYFTADAQPRLNDPAIPARQQAYLRALQTIANLTIHKGQFKNREIERPLVNPLPGMPRTVRVHHMEEKGSDVNLATYLLVDGYEDDYEQALIISNDSDLALPINMIREKLQKPVGIVNPNIDCKEHTPIELKDSATFMRQIRLATLKKCQFPATLHDNKGIISKPPGW